VPYALVGDANKPGDFLTCLRDAWMVALSVDHRFRRHDPAGAETLNSPDQSQTTVHH